MHQHFAYICYYTFPKMANMQGNDFLESVFKGLESKKPSFRQLVESRKKELKIASDLELSKMVNIPNNTLRRLIDGETEKTDLFSILRVCHLLGISEVDMIQNYAASLPPKDIGELETVGKANFILKNFNLPLLRKMKFIKSTTNFKEIDEKITKFFGLKSIYLYTQDILPPVLFTKIKRYSNDEMTMLWQMGAYAQFDKFENPNEYDKEAFLSLVPKIRSYTQYEETGLLIVIRALYRIGVTVIVQQYLSTTSIRGASFIVNKKPCIVITDIGKAYSTLWFTLLHEICHILWDYEELKSWGIHCTGEGTVLSNDLFNENRANEFAQERLLPKNLLDFISPMIKSPATVNDFALKNKVHAGIIYSLYCYNEKIKNNKDYYAQYQHLFGKSDIAVSMIRLSLLDEKKESVYEGLEHLKYIYEFTEK